MIEEGLSFEEYRKRDGVSQSLMKLFDYDSGGCPALYKHATETGEMHGVSTKALDDGRRYHHFLLEPESFARYYAELTPEIEAQLFKEALASKSKAKCFSQRLGSFLAWKEIQESAGRSIVTRDEAQQLRDMRDAVHDNPDVSEWFSLKESKLEVSMFAEYNGFKLKARADIIPAGDAIIDLKTARTSHPDEFARVAWRLGYHIQAGFYVDVARLCGLNKTRFGFLAQDKFAPYLACIHWMGEDWMTYGRKRYRKILLDIAEAIRFDQWPGYRSGELMPPHYAAVEMESVAA